MLKKFKNKGPELFGLRIDPDKFPYVEIGEEPAGRCPSGPTSIKVAFAVKADGTKTKCPWKLAVHSRGEKINMLVK